MDKTIKNLDDLKLIKLSKILKNVEYKRYIDLKKKNINLIKDINNILNNEKEELNNNPQTFY